MRKSFAEGSEKATSTEEIIWGFPGSLLRPFFLMSPDDFERLRKGFIVLST